MIRKEELERDLGRYVQKVDGGMSCWRKRERGGVPSSMSLHRLARMECRGKVNK